MAKAQKKPRKLKFQDVFNEIQAALYVSSGEYVAGIFNQVCSKNLRYVEADGKKTHYWEEVQEPDKDLAGICPYCKSPSTTLIDDLLQEYQCDDCEMIYRKVNCLKVHKRL
jgi:hypothetical protein